MVFNRLSFVVIKQFIDTLGVANIATRYSIITPLGEHFQLHWARAFLLAATRKQTPRIKGQHVEKVGIG